MDTSCVVCEEVYPVSPAAIFTRNVEATNRWGEIIELEQPYIDPVKCIGCGICEHECLFKDKPAVYVTTVGETRSKDRLLLLALVHGQEQDLVFVRSELSPDFPKSVWSMVKGSSNFPSVQSTRSFGSALPRPRERFGEWSFTKGSNRVQ
jgi:ferredoxin